MDRSELLASALASVLVDEALVAAMMPIACPCDFGPSRRYRLEELVGVGRHSLVYRAHDRRLSSEGFEAPVAVKLMKSGATDTEALTARRVMHPNVLRVLDRGIDVSGHSYLVVEHVDGGDLSERPVPWKPYEAARFMRKVAAGVQAAHSAGVVHCDLKPSNILLTKEGEPKVSDFDLAFSPVASGKESRGNLAFMSPEQFRGEENAISPPSDIYALGGILYYLLTGKLPHGENRETVNRVHAAGGPDVAAAVHGDLGRICARAMSPLRDDRYHSAGSMVEDLDRYLAHQPIPWIRPSVLHRGILCTRRRPYLTSALVLTLSLGGTTAAVIGYNRIQERWRATRAKEEADRMAAEKVEATRKRLLTILETLYRSTFTNPSGDLIDRMLPTLVWLNFMSDLPVVSPEGRVALSADRIEGLRDGLVYLVNSGRSDHVEAMLTRYSLAYFLISDGDDTEALLLIVELEGRWLPKLAKDDPMVQAVSSLKVLAQANAAMKSPNDLPAAIERIDVLEAELSSPQAWEPVRRLAQRIGARLKKAEKQAAEGHGNGPR